MKIAEAADIAFEVEDIVKAAKGVISSRQVAERVSEIKITDIGKTTVHEILTVLVDRKRIEQVGRGRYSGFRWIHRN